LPKKKARAGPNAQEEQLRLLHLILAELQKMNASMAATAAKPALQGMIGTEEDDDGDPDAEELEYFE
jgi:hypothetical protein